MTTRAARPSRCFLPLRWTRSSNIPRFNSDINGAEYDKDHYDYIAGTEEYLTGSAAPMGKSSGANQYYSDNNPLKSSGIHQFIPDAEGRHLLKQNIRRTIPAVSPPPGGVGPTFKLGSNHETKYYYNVPTQEDLDAIFGTEAGLAYHYSKNTTIDPNGQAAVSYLDMRGRTVATALLASPQSAVLDDLPSKEVLIVTDSLSGAGKNILRENVMESRHSQTVGVAGMYNSQIPAGAAGVQQKGLQQQHGLLQRHLRSPYQDHR